MQPNKPLLSHYYFTPGLLLVFFLVSGAGFAAQGKKLLFPGPISGTSPKGQPLNGYVNHAEFEQNCQHCHAPVHCISDNRCETCHIEIARQRTSADEGLHSRLPDAGRCQACHLEHRGREVVMTEFAFLNVDHSQLANFSLAKHETDYAGSPLNCQSCHSRNRFIKDTLDCVTCHVEEDHDYMAAHIDTYGASCIPCHDGSGRYSGWEHSLAYVLDGGHQDLECQDCHQEQNFLNTSRECAGCHEDTTVHSGIFGSECQRCHTTEAWIPAYLTSHTFDLDHGSDEIHACSTCHEGDYTVNSCYGCHDHQPAEMLNIHLQEGIYEYYQCAECHPTGKNEEDRRLRESLPAEVP